MPLVQVRIDDRLIHGTVVVGWRDTLNPDRIMLCSNEVSATEWQKTIYLSAVPSDLQASVLTVNETVTALQNGDHDSERVLMLVENPKTVVELINAGIAIDEVNVGGMHFKPGKNQIAQFIFVDQQDVDHFKILHEKGVVFDGRDVPSRDPVDLVYALNFDE